MPTQSILSEQVTLSPYHLLSQSSHSALTSSCPTQPFSKITWKIDTNLNLNSMNVQFTGTRHKFLWFWVVSGNNLGALWMLNVAGTQQWISSSWWAKCAAVVVCHNRIHCHYTIVKNDWYLVHLKKNIRRWIWVTAWTIAWLLIRNIKS